MTVTELIERLSMYPADMRVIFTADMGHISTSQPAVFVATTDEGNGDYDGPVALYIDID